MGWQHSIAGGQGKMVVKVFQSPNYVPGVSGWAVFIDGSAEFNNLVIRGTFQGTDFEINASGAFFYSGPPANGHLAVSIAGAPGTDRFGNAFVKGVASYLGTNYLALQAFALISSLGTTLQAVTPGPDGTNPAWQLNAFTATLGLISELTGDGIKVIVDNPLVALKPGSAVGSHTPEIWHVVGAGGEPAFASGWANSGGGLASLQFTLTADNDTHLIGNITSAASTATAFVTLPAAYRPAVGQDIPVAFHTGTGYTQGAFLRVSTAGVCSIVNSTTTTGIVCISARIPLAPST